MEKAQETRVRLADDAALAEAVALIRAGQPVAVPTETVYGLAADATSGEAVARIYAAKGRPSFNPLIVHVADRAMAERIARFSGLAARLADAFWPGPLTLVLPLAPAPPVAALATAGLPTVALRMPAHRVMRALMERAGVPLAAPSANRSGAISPTTASHVLASLAGRIPLVLDAGACVQGLESTIIGVHGEALLLHRPGPVHPDAIEDAVGVRPVMRAPEEGICAPGQLASHYAPSKPVQLEVVTPAPDQFLIGFGPVAGHLSLSQAGDLVEAAARLFAALHQADAAPQARIAVAPVPHWGIGLAINDRLRRAAA